MLCYLLVFVISTVCGEFIFYDPFFLCECEHICHLRGRHGAISIKKIKNNMLAAVLVLTIVPLWVKVGKAVVEHGCFLISQKLLDADEVSSIPFSPMALSLFNVNSRYPTSLFLDIPNGGSLR